MNTTGKRIKAIALATLLLLQLVSITSCQEGKPQHKNNPVSSVKTIEPGAKAKAGTDNKVDMPVDPNEHGNTASNLLKLGLFAQKGDWVYFYRHQSDYYDSLKDNAQPSSKPQNPMGLYKMKADGSDQIKLNNDEVEYINVVGNWIYYKRAEPHDDDPFSYSGGKIYRVKVDGTHRTKVCDDLVEQLVVVGEWIYYHNASDFGRLYKIKTDGTCRTRLNYDYTLDINVSGDWIYYRNYSYGNKIYRIHTNGTGRTKLNDDHCTQVIVEGDWIYYSSYSDSDQLFRIKSDGTGKTRISDKGLPCINISSDYIYFAMTSGSPQDGYIDILYCMKPDGTKTLKLLEDKTIRFYVVGQWIYYWTDDCDLTIYRLRVDGTIKRISIDVNNTIYTAKDEISLNNENNFEAENEKSNFDQKKWAESLKPYSNILGIDLPQLILDTYSEKDIKDITVDIYNTNFSKNSDSNQDYHIEAYIENAEWWKLSGKVMLVFVNDHGRYKLKYKNTGRRNYRFDFIDIDTDNRMELIREESIGGNGTTHTTVEVLRYTGTEFRTIFKRDLERREPFPYSYSNSYWFTRNKDNSKLLDIVYSINTEFGNTFYDPNYEELGDDVFFIEKYKRNFEIFGNNPPKPFNDEVLFKFNGSKYVPTKKLYDYNKYFREM